MHKPEFDDLTRRLLAAGVAPRFVARTVEELSDHFQDIEADALAAGYAADEFPDRQVAVEKILVTDEDAQLLLDDGPVRVGGRGRIGKGRRSGTPEA